MKRILVALAIAIFALPLVAANASYSVKNIADVGIRTDVHQAEIIFGHVSTGRIASNAVPVPPVPEANTSGMVIVRDAGFLQVPQKEVIFILTRDLGPQSTIAFRQVGVVTGTATVPTVYTFPQGAQAGGGFLIWQGPVMSNTDPAIDFQVGTYDPRAFQNSITSAQIGTNGQPSVTVPFLESVIASPAKVSGMTLNLEGEFIPSPLKVTVNGYVVASNAIILGPVDGSGYVRTVTINMSSDPTLANLSQADYDVSVEQFGWSDTLHYRYRILGQQKG